MVGLGAGAGVPGTVKCVADGPSVAQSEGTLAAAVDGVTSNLSKLNSLWDKRSIALYVVNSRRLM